VKRESNIGGIGGLLDEAPEDLTGSNAKEITAAVISADVHRPDEAALPAARNRKSASEILAAELLVVLLAGDLPPLLPVPRRLDDPRIRMFIARNSCICVVTLAGKMPFWTDRCGDIRGRANESNPGRCLKAQ
jgi:hypothetical protein